MAPESKRQRREVFEAASYAAGAIRRVKLHNFMSYSDAELWEPGPRLNCIVGPNGTGKSSIVNALAIVLGGTLKLTERGNSSDDAIKKGCEKGYIEVELRDGNGPGKDLLVRCDLSRAGGRKTDYSLDGKHVPLKEVKERMAALGIQIDNMLQFLPQDKVAQFTQMKPTDLLLNTLKATLPAEYAEHAELARLSSHAAELGADKAAKERELQKALSLQESYQGEVDRLRAFQAHEQKKNEIEGKRLWRAAFGLTAEVDAKKGVARGAKDARKAAERALKEVAAPVAAAEAAARGAAAQHKAAEARLKEAKAKAAAAADEVTSTLFDQIDELDTKLTQAEHDNREREAAANAARAHLARGQAELDKLPAVDEAGTRAEIAALDGRMRAATTARGDAEDLQHAKAREAKSCELQLKECRGRLRMLDDHALAREAKLQAHSEGAKALRLRQWVKENASLFEGEVLGPIGLHCEAADPQAAAWLEAAIPRSVLLGFLAVTDRDRDLLAKRVLDEKLGVNVYKFDQRSGRGVKPPYDAHSAELKSHGILGWLSERLSARELVHNFLASFANLSSTLVGSESICAPDKMRAFEVHMRAQGHGSYKLYTPATVFNASTSRYGERKQTVGTSALRAPNGGPLVFLGAQAADPAERARRAHALEAAERALGAAKEAGAEAARAVAAAEAEVAEVRAAKSAVNADAQRVAKARARLAELQERARLAAAEADPQALQRARATLQADMAKLFDRLAAKAPELARAHAAGAAESLGAQCAALGARAAAEREREAKEACAAAREAAATALRDEELARTALKKAEGELLKAVTAAQAAAPDFQDAAPGAFALEGAAKAAWEGLPDDDDALADELAHVQAELDKSTADQDALRRHAEVSASIERLRASLADYEAQASGQGQALADRRAAWEPKVREMAERVSSKFAQYFAAFRCVGEVQLGTAERIEDYALNIRVKWRESEQLHTLADGGRDSGGERSVATMVYLIALQDVNPCPFRVVDEINQAMDPTNERRIFECITQAVSSQRSRTQYFLITPKLLPDLHYSEHTAVHFIYNGPFMQPAAKLALDLSAEPAERRASVSPDDDE